MDSPEGVICVYAFEFLSLGEQWNAYFFLPVKGDGPGKNATILSQSKFHCTGIKSGKFVLQAWF